MHLAPTPTQTGTKRKATEHKNKTNSPDQSEEVALWLYLPWPRRVQKGNETKWMHAKATRKCIRANSYNSEKTHSQSPTSLLTYAESECFRFVQGIFQQTTVEKFVQITMLKVQDSKESKIFSRYSIKIELFVLRARLTHPIRNPISPVRIAMNQNSPKTLMETPTLRTIQLAYLNSISC